MLHRARPNRINPRNLRRKVGKPLHGRVAIKVIDFNGMPTPDSGGKRNALTNLEYLLIAMHAWQTGSFHWNSIQRHGIKKGGGIKNKDSMSALMDIYVKLCLPVQPNKKDVLDKLDLAEETKEQGSAKGLAMYAESIAPGDTGTRGLRFAQCAKNTGLAPHLTGNKPAVVCTVTCKKSPAVKYPLKSKP